MPSIENKKKDFDVVVAGGGMAGVFASAEMAKRGLRVALVEKKKGPPEKSLFVNKGQIKDESLISWLVKRGDFIPCPDFLLINADNPERSVAAHHQQGDTGAVFHAPIIAFGRAQFHGKVEEMHGRVAASRELKEGVEVTLNNGQTINANYLVDATGTHSQVSRNHVVEGHSEKLVKDNPLGFWMWGFRAHGAFRPGVLIDPIGSEIGGLSWILPYSSNHGDIIASSPARLYQLDPHEQQQTLERLINFCERNGLCHIDGIDNRFRGFIRCQPIARSAVTPTRRLYTLGEAAGMGSPLMGEVVPAALYWGTQLADFIAEDKTPIEFYNQWRKKEQFFPYDMEMALLRRRFRHAEQGNYGSNGLFYQTVVSHLPEDAQQEVLMNRKIPRRYWSYIVKAMIQNPEIIPNFGEIAVEWSKVKISNLANR